MIHYVPIWIDKNDKVGRGFPYKSLEDCKDALRKRGGLGDKEYMIKVIEEITFPVDLGLGKNGRVPLDKKERLKL